MEVHDDRSLLALQGPAAAEVLQVGLHNLLHLTDHPAEALAGPEDMVNVMA
jgi:hypothetical protein